MKIKSFFTIKKRVKKRKKKIKEILNLDLLILIYF